MGLLIFQDDESAYMESKNLGNYDIPRGQQQRTRSLAVLQMGERNDPKYSRSPGTPSSAFDRFVEMMTHKPVSTEHDGSVRYESISGQTLVMAPGVITTPPLPSL